MMSVFSFGTLGMDTYTVRVEVDTSPGLPAFDVVGLPDAAVRESRERVRSACKNSGFRFPTGRVVVNLSPADVRKEGPMYDLAMLVALLGATEQFDFDPRDIGFIGELSLDGHLRPVKGIVGMIIGARQAGFKQVFIPEQNRSEGGVIDGIEVYPAATVNDIFSHLQGGRLLERAVYRPGAPEEASLLDFAEVRGQYEAKRALEVSAAGSHNVLLIGPPGSGKSMLAKRMPTIMPPMSFEESIEVTKLYSLAGKLIGGGSLITTRPFRTPHHTISTVGLSGGGHVPGPGEISLAHCGVLFLDEFPEFSRQTMEVLRQPLEDGTITISRASGSFTFPCGFMLIAAMNPCPCGYFGSPTRPCICGKAGVERYLARLSGPMLDRMDLHIEVPQVPFDQLADHRPGEPSAVIAARVAAARARQHERFSGTCRSNAAMTPGQVQQFCRLDDATLGLLRAAFERLGLSARSHDRLLKISRTIADLDGSDDIRYEHMAEAIQYRSLDRKYWH